MPRPNEKKIDLSLVGFGNSEHRTPDGLTVKAFARLRLDRSDDNLPPRTVILAVQEGPAPDEGEGRILSEDAHGQLEEILLRLDVTLPEGNAMPLSR